MQLYEIAEIFYSIQAEGYFSGTPAIFIRFCGCNLCCEYCDEPLHKLPGQFLSREQIYDRIKEYQSLHIVLTGGEPGIVEDLGKLLKFLKTKKNYYIQIETNGTSKLNFEVDFITVSPKTDNFIPGDELKVLFTKDTNLDKIYKPGYKHYYIQPVSTGDELDLDNIYKAIEEIKKDPRWRLSFQYHKVLNID